MTEKLNIFNFKSMNELRVIKKTAIERINAPGILHADVAKAMGVSKSWVSLFSRGAIKNPGIETVATLLDVLSELEARLQQTNSMSNNNLPDKTHSPSDSSGATRPCVAAS